MALPPVNVNPQSSIYAAPQSGGGSPITIGDRTFNIGGNPNITAIASKPWPWALAAAAVVIGIYLLRRG